MKTLLLMRHAKSTHKDPSLPDHDRPLNTRGERDAPRMGRRLRAENLMPDFIVSSPAKRALATAEAVAVASHYASALVVAADLYPGEPAAFVRVLSHLPEKCHRVLIVGHNPGLEMFIGELTGTAEALPTAAVAVVDLPIERWQEFCQETRATLRHVWRPREVE